MALDHSRSTEVFGHARTVIPGGVNSPVRAFSNVGIDPVFYDRAQGAQVWDIDGNAYLDFICSWGPMIFGHGDPEILDAVRCQLDRGVSFGAPCEAEVRLADLICSVAPGVEEVRMVSSGTEATMTAIRLARGCTGRDKIIKFQGNYHGHSDSLLVSAGSGVATLGIPDTPGVTAATASDTMVATYNNLDSVRSLFEAAPDQVACVIVEPVSGNMGVVAPQEGFLRGLRDLCDQFGALLIMDEVITGFRVALGGAQQLFGVSADLCTYGKIIGGGFPVGCVAGRERFMSNLAPAGSVYQAGTLSGNPVAMEAGLAQIRKLAREADRLYPQLQRKSDVLFGGLRDAASQAGVQVQVNALGSVGTVFFTPDPVVDWQTAARSDRDAFAVYFRAMLDQGLLIAPSQFEAVFLSDAHTDQHLQAFLAAAHTAFAQVANR
ncbi:glutamate-1-semialdehyde 2,1-aminomutase [Eggerthellaceae bacterium zg-997]|nr:glutamate-1-semialdehyde 2,1-aminomutase [Eggerthellaceae bacterium zg-997]